MSTTTSIPLLRPTSLASIDVYFAGFLREENFTFTTATNASSREVCAFLEKRMDTFTNSITDDNTWKPFLLAVSPA